MAKVIFSLLPTIFITGYLDQAFYYITNYQNITIVLSQLFFLNMSQALKDVQVTLNAFLNQLSGLDK
jgi:hypothetical protein